MIIELGDDQNCSEKIKEAWSNLSEEKKEEMNK